ncbi:unnamed protein product [Rhizophagus irregularis]|uniref:Uncharacterized protein n=1 Tax=Rhizophagus irregularis TaxID=588596 RepID=A0A915ZQB7_9GLOM|nr:unnamed protein product [Rhizophagus irregularis]
MQEHRIFLYNTCLPLIHPIWYIISKDSHARTFHAVRLHKVIQALLSHYFNVISYFVQHLLMHFGYFDEKLIELKIEHNVNQVDFDRIRAFQKKLQSP